VKGLISDDSGNTFNEWLNYLGGKSVNGTGTMFPIDGCVPYHIYWKVLNAKDYGVPQNRERVFIVGIRDDKDSFFNFPKVEPLTKRLKDVLEPEVDEKYYLSEKMVNVLTHHKNPIIKNETPEKSACIHAGYFKMGGRDQQYVKDTIEEPKVIQLNPSKESGGKQPFQQNRVYDINGIMTTLDTDSGRKNILEIETKIDYDNTDASGLYLNCSKNFDRGPLYGLSRGLKAGNHDAGVIFKNRIRKLTPIEAFRLMDFPDSLVENARNYKKNIYFHFIYSIFAKNKQETIWNAKLKVVKEQQTPKNLETYVLCTTKECIKMEALMTLRQKKNPKIEKKENVLNVNFAIEVLGGLGQKECATNIIKWTDCTETLYTMMLKKGSQVVVDISDTITEKDCIEPLWKITLEENLKEERLFITLILLKQIIKSKIYTYVKMRPNTQKYISSIINYEKNSDTLSLSYLRMDYTEQLVSDSMLYKQAGNSIVVAVLEKIIKNLKL
jgi:DNA-cytosine methyltransferase